MLSLQLLVKYPQLPATLNFRLLLFAQMGPTYGILEAVFEIKGTLGARRAHFRGRAHVCGRVHPMCANFFTQFSLQYTRGVHRKIPGRTVSICVHPRGAQNKTLISNTVRGQVDCAKFYFQRKHIRPFLLVYDLDCNTN